MRVMVLIMLVCAFSLEAMAQRMDTVVYPPHKVGIRANFLPVLVFRPGLDLIYNTQEALAYYSSFSVSVETRLQKRLTISYPVSIYLDHHLGLAERYTDVYTVSAGVSPKYYLNPYNIVQGTVQADVGLAVGVQRAPRVYAYGTVATGLVINPPRAKQVNINMQFIPLGLHMPFGKENREYRGMFLGGVAIGAGYNF